MVRVAVLLAAAAVLTATGCGKPERASPGSTVRVRLPPAKRVAAAPGFSIARELDPKAVRPATPPVE